jgi:hypothetical protein
MSRPELISRTTRGLFRDLMTSSSVGRIGAAFQDEGFAPSSDCTYVAIGVPGRVGPQGLQLGVTTVRSGPR